MFEIKVVGLEELLYNGSQLGCYVYIDGRLHDVITPLNETEEPGVEVTHGELRLIVKMMGEEDETLGSVTLATNLLPKDGFQWLPLFEDLSHDSLSELPAEVIGPRILVLVNAKYILSPVPELTERSEAESEQDTRLYSSKLMDEISLNFKKDDLELSQNLLGTKELRERHQNTIYQLKQSFKESLSKSKKREESLLKLLKHKDKLILETQNKVQSTESECLKIKLEKERLDSELSQYKAEVEALEVEKLQEELSHYFEKAETNSEAANKLQEENSQLKLKLEELEYELQEKQVESDHKQLLSKQEIEALSSKLSSLSQENQQLKEKLKEQQFSKTCPLSNFQNDPDEVDSAVKNYLAKINSPDLLVKHQKNVYKYKDKKLWIYLKNNILYCRTKQGVKTLHKLINELFPDRKRSTSHPETVSPEKRHRRNKTINGGDEENHTPVSNLSKTPTYFTRESPLSRAVYRSTLSSTKKTKFSPSTQRALSNKRAPFK